MHPKKDQIIGLDFETYAAVSLPDVGLMNYVKHPTFQVTLAGISTNSNSFAIEFVPSRSKRASVKELADIVTEPGIIVTAHNAGFERTVLQTLGIDVNVRDSAVVAAVAGANRHLAQAAEQLLGMSKLDADRSLLTLFAMPPKDVGEDAVFDEGLLQQNPDQWAEFIQYCLRDAELSRRLYIEWFGEPKLMVRELKYARLTQAMNERGWPVDLDLVGQMKTRYEMNLERILDEFRTNVDNELNLNSHEQLKRWCTQRGVRSHSFDKQNVERLIHRLETKRSPLTHGQGEVLHMLRTKQALGGSSLKKLDVILATQHEGRVYDQYVHAGAAQSLRTSGRSVQMQNLKRLNGPPQPMVSIDDPAVSWTNEQLADNLRQVFRAENPDGQLFVADFSSIESRALAWLAGESWKLDTYRIGEDVYKMQATKIFGLASVAMVTKAQRQIGKVGELSCGYGAGPVAVKDFAEKMGVSMSEGEAKRLVYDWRDANPKTTRFWTDLHEALTTTVTTGGFARIHLRQDYQIVFAPEKTPPSLQAIDPDAFSISMELWHRGDRLMARVFHGCHMRGSNIGYYKPSSLKSGAAWKKTYTDPKTKQTRRYELYGGKLAGILTQSLCREIFFDRLLVLERTLTGYPNVQIIGQFHDEVVVEWEPGPMTDNELSDRITVIMSQSGLLPSLPMAVEVKSARRYIK